MEQTLVIIKPDAVAAGHTGAILARLEDLGLRLLRLDLRTITPEFADQHYAEHLERDFYPPLREFMTSGPMVVAVLEGDDAIQRVRDVLGPTDSREAGPGTLRGDFGTDNRRNAVHASDAPASATREIELWYPA